MKELIERNALLLRDNQSLRREHYVESEVYRSIKWFMLSQVRYCSPLTWIRHQTKAKTSRHFNLRLNNADLLWRVLKSRWLRMLDKLAFAWLLISQFRIQNANFSIRFLSRLSSVTFSGGLWLQRLIDRLTSAIVDKESGVVYLRLNCTTIRSGKWST